ncbi:MAG: hypothetical protein M0R51_16890 [Clostridia bacterium]|jgi:hypothetical protein|nr:hypothetical protein [Clostridia bacterium]
MKYEYNDNEYADVEQLIEAVGEDMKQNLTDEEYIKEIDEYEDVVVIMGNKYSPGRALMELDYNYFLKNKNEDIWYICDEIKNDVIRTHEIGVEFPIPYTDEVITILEV